MAIERFRYIKGLEDTNKRNDRMNLVTLFLLCVSSKPHSQAEV